MRIAGLVVSILSIPGLLLGIVLLGIWFASQGTFPVFIGLIPFLSGVVFGIVGLSLLKAAKKQTVQ